MILIATGLKREAQILAGPDTHIIPGGGDGVRLRRELEAAAGIDAQAPVMRKAVDWLVNIQNPDGGWGEDCESYALDYAGYTPFASNPAQTAWALLGLMAVGEVEHPAAARGVEYLMATQTDAGTWDQEAYTGGGFPRVFYLRYHGYPKFFPLWAVARYRNLTRSNDRQVAFGM